MPLVPKPRLLLPKIPAPKPRPPIPPKIIMRETINLTPDPPVKRGPGRPPKPKDPNAPEQVKRPRGRPRKNPPAQPLTAFDPRRNPTFEEAFPRAEGPDQIKFTPGEGWKILADDEHFITVIMDVGSFTHVWGLLRIECKRHWGSTLTDQGAYKRALQAFGQAYKESNQ